MKPSPPIILALVLAVAVAAYALGRFQGKRATGGGAAVVGTDVVVTQSMLAPGPRNGGDLRGDSAIEVNPDLDARAFVDALVAARKAVTAENMGLAIEKAAQEVDPVKGNLLFAQLLQLLTPENAQSALEALSGQQGGGLIDNQRRLFRFAWGQLDGTAAADYVVSELSGRNARYAAYSVMSGWASVEPNAAIGWVETVEDEGQREYYYRGVIGGLAKYDPDLATQFALERHAAGDKEADDYISTIAREQMKQGTEVITAWIDTIAPVELKQDAVYQVARTMVHREPEEAAQWVEAYAGNEFAVRAIGEVADEWAEEDGASAAQWVARLPAGDARSGAFGQVFNEWTEDDPLAASQYLVNMPNGPDRDAGAQALARRHAREDPEAAVTWAASISDEAIRNSTLTNTGQQWIRRDQEKAEAWLQTSGLPDEVQEKIRDPAARQNNQWQFRTRFIEGGQGTTIRVAPRQ